MVAQLHPNFPQPENANGKIWRYLSLSKFLSFLVDQSLHFSRAKYLGDPFENALPKQFRFVKHELINRRERGIDIPRPYSDMSNEQIQEMFQQVVETAKTGLNDLYVSCWHYNEFESAAMWNIYSRSSESIAIQSTFAKLSDTLPEFCWAGMVRYIDYDTEIFDFMDFLNAIMHKRRSFEFEREVRAVAWDLHMRHGGYLGIPDSSPYGLKVPIEVHSLVERVYIHPEAPDWFLDSVENLIQRYELNVPVVRSTLSEQPLW